MGGEPEYSPPARGGVAAKRRGWWEYTCLRTFKPANARRDAARRAGGGMVDSINHSWASVMIVTWGSNQPFPARNGRVAGKKRARIWSAPESFQRRRMKAWKQMLLPAFISRACNLDASQVAHNNQYVIGYGGYVSVQSAPFFRAYRRFHAPL